MSFHIVYHYLTDFNEDDPVFDVGLLFKLESLAMQRLSQVLKD
jgi:hypothetical protein